MKQRDLVALAAAVLGATVLTTDVRAGQVWGNLKGPPGTSAAVEIEISCPGRADKSGQPDKPAAGGSEKTAKADKAAEPEQPAMPALPKSYKTPAKMPGPYSVNVEQQGDCTLAVSYQGMTASLPVVSQKGSVQYDLLLSDVEGKLKVIRQ